MKFFFLFLMSLGLSACATSSFHTTRFTATTTHHVIVTPLEVPAYLPTFTTIQKPILPQLDEQQWACMTEALYFEARSESDQGQLAIGHVIMNRVADKRFPSTPCGVVHQGKYRNGKIVRNQCQFSYWCDGKNETFSNTVAYERARELAASVLLEVDNNPIGTSLFFHRSAHYRAKRIARADTVFIGHHVFMTKYVRARRLSTSPASIASLVSNRETPTPISNPSG